jgi:cell division protein FtsB
MAETQGHPLYVATRRLVAALDRLENNLKNVTHALSRDVHQEQQMVFFERENAALKQERESLNAAIAQLQYQYNDLHKVASTIYGKLDDSIRRLSQIIED